MQPVRQQTFANARLERRLTAPRVDESIYTLQGQRLARWGKLQPLMAEFLTISRALKGAPIDWSYQLRMLQAIAKYIYKVTGWSYEEQPDIWEKKQVVVGFPHTSNMDGVLALALFKIYGLKPHVVIKKELFFWPLGPLLRSLGGVPIDRKQRTNFVEQMRQNFEDNDEYTVALAPEATRNKQRAKRKPIKTGFWHIAKAANVPIVLLLADAAHKVGRIVAKITPSDSIYDDLTTIRDLYAKYGVDILIPGPENMRPEDNISKPVPKESEA